MEHGLVKEDVRALGKENPDMTMSQEQLILKRQGQWEEMAGFVRQAAKGGQPIGSAVRFVARRHLRAEWRLQAARGRGRERI